ncbi:MAG TPA: hypothetical protein VNE40_02985 [Candidatus Dormibacteraeota bacterium]|nr:hypothetical protein [Candidatus Dormibacteraeota bacterium]
MTQVPEGLPFRPDYAGTDRETMVSYFLDLIVACQSGTEGMTQLESAGLVVDGLATAIGAVKSGFTTEIRYQGFTNGLPFRIEVKQ